MPTRITGLGSGLDIDTLVQQQMKVKQIPIDMKKQKLTLLSWQRDAYRDVNKQVSSFLSEVRKLTLQSTFLSKKVSLSSDDAQKVTATPTADALTGNFTLQVKQIAKSAMVTGAAIGSDPTKVVASNTFTLNVTGELGTAGISISAGDNISQVISKINAQSSSTGVKASYDQLMQKVTLVSTNTGQAASIKLDASGDINGDFLSNLGLAAAGVTHLGDTAQGDAAITGQDALVNFNGSGDTYVRSNTFVMGNINFTILKDPSALGVSDYTISGSNNIDIDTVVNTIKGVFDKYNELIDSLNSKISEKKYRDYPPLTDDQKKDMKDSEIELWEEKAKSGLLRNDSVISMGLDKMRRYLSDPVSGIPGTQYDSLADIGITTKPSDGSNSLAYLEHGKIYVDEDKLRKALTENPDQVMNLFTKEGARDASGKLVTGQDAGIGTRLFDTVNNMIKGLTEKTQTVPTKSSLMSQIDDLTSYISLEQSKLSEYEQKLYSQYSKLDTALGQLNSQGSYLSSFFQLGS